MVQGDRTFAELFCERHGLPPRRYERELFRRTLYPQARLLAPWLRRVDSGFFKADLEFVRGVGRIMRTRDFHEEVINFAHHPDNLRWSRRILRLRVSTQRLREQVRAVMHGELPAPGRKGSKVPFV